MPKPHAPEQHIVGSMDDIPVFGLERRKRPDRREVWRGGRRDSDWLNRPPGALDRIARNTAWWLAWWTSREREKKSA